MLEQQLELIKINIWANTHFRTGLKPIFKEMRDMPTPYGSFGELVYHVFGAIYFWMKRLGVADYELKALKDMPSTEEVFAAWELAEKKLLAMVEKQAKEAKTIPKFKYKTAKGDEFDISLDLLILQLNNHSYYHRGQIGYIIRSSGKTPLPSTDATAYYREKTKKA